MKQGKKFKLLDCVMAVVCVVLTVEAAAPAAAIGNSQIFWWLFLLPAFCLPYSLISAELGTTYPGEGGIYEWVKRAFGKRWGARVSWYYWINFPLWVASLSVLCTDSFPNLFGVELSSGMALAVRLVFIWGVVGLSLVGVAENKWLFNICTGIKVLNMLLLGVGGIAMAVTKGLATPLQAGSILPSINLGSLAFLSVIIYNFMGFEVVTTFVEQMDKPKRQIPVAIISGGIIVAAMYLLASLGVGAAIPQDKLTSASGVADTIRYLLGSPAQWVMSLVGVLLLFTLFVNQLSWAFGVNFVARSCAKDGGMPKVFALSGKKGATVGASLMNGLVASVLVLLAPLIQSQELFWSFFALNLVTFLLSYVLFFPAFWKLRKMDPDIPRPYKVFGGKRLTALMTFVPMALLVAAIFFTIVPLSSEEVPGKLLLLVGTVIAVLLGEVMARREAVTRKE